MCGKRSSWQGKTHTTSVKGVGCVSSTAVPCAGTGLLELQKSVKGVRTTALTVVLHSFQFRDLKIREMINTGRALVEGRRGFGPGAPALGSIHKGIGAGRDN